MRTVVYFYEVLIILLHRSTQTVNFSLISVNLCKFMAWCSIALADNSHAQFNTKLLSKKVRLICLCLQYIIYQSDRFHVAVHLFSNRSQRRRNKVRTSVAHYTVAYSWAMFLLLRRFDVTSAIL